ncbi:MAG TPA: 5-formyltetrahydrofolate cyclo-ligase [Steroidobacteraceae bacterium]|nr:5-formyltetrahydrofolate cyclo-ligase [Steroidobacteraceae bacterium]
MTSSRSDLRRQMRARRRLVTVDERKIAARRFAIAADRSHLLRPSLRIAVYQPYGHEADIAPLTRRAWDRGCIVHAPVITDRNRFIMRFVPYEPNARLQTNSFGIPEPANTSREWISPLHLDLIFMPLVAFDSRGWRLGSGAGFYDRSLSYLRFERRWRRPKLIGVAYEHQLIDELVPGEWDVPMDAVITEARIHRFQSHHSGSTR